MIAQREQKMIRIWLNHWFSTAYSIIQLIKKDESDFRIIGSNERENTVYKKVCDEWHIEPVLKEEEYVSYCLDFCVKNYPAKLYERYGTDESLPAHEMLYAIGEKRGCLGKNGEISYEKAANAVLDDFRSGKLGRITLELPEDN
jgi:ribosome biogenesis GTPase A